MTLNRYQIRQAMTMALNKSPRSVRNDVTAVVDGFVNQLVQLNDEHIKQLAMLKAAFDSEIAALSREFDSLKMETGAFRPNSVETNIVRLKVRRDEDDGPHQSWMHSVSCWSPSGICFPISGVGGRT